MVIACFYMPHIGLDVERMRSAHLRGQPVALSGPDDALLVVSPEAAPFGIKVGQSASGARGLCERLAVMPYDTEAYNLAARTVWNLCAIESSVVEPISPEICYVLLTGACAESIAQNLYHRLIEAAPSPIYAGFAQTKLLARLAARKAEGETPNCKLTIDNCQLSIKNTSLTRQTLDKLHTLNIRTFGDLQKIPLRELQRQFKEAGLVLYRMARGEDNDPVKPAWPPRGLEASFNLEDEVSDEATIREAIRLCGERLADRLAAANEYCRKLTLCLTLADGEETTVTEKTAMPLNSCAAIHRAGLRLLQRAGVGKPVLAVHLSAADLGGGSGIQLTLMDKNDRANGLPHEQQKKLESASEFLRKKYGPRAVASGSTLRKDRRISLWTYPLGHAADEPIQVATDAQGRPVRFWRKGHPREIKRIQDSWKETEWFWGSLDERTIYRVETDPSGLCELERREAGWRLNGVAD